MTRKAHIIGLIALVLTATAVRTPVFDCLVSSAQTFHHRYRNLAKPGTPLSPIERVVFSLIPANEKAAVSNHRS